MKTYEVVRDGILAEYDDSRADNPQFWDEVWRRKDLARILRQASKGRLQGFRFLEQRLPRSGKILEAGCGTGQFVASLKALGYAISGVDNATEVIQRAKDCLPELDVQVGNLRRLPYADGEFSAYLCFGVIEHFTDPVIVDEILSEARRVTNGVAFFSTPHYSPRLHDLQRRGKLPRRSAGSAFYQYHFTTEELQRILAQQGFKVMHWNYYATINGLVRHHRWFRCLYQNVLPFRLAVGRIPEFVDRFAGRSSSHMIGAWCQVHSD